MSAGSDTTRAPESLFHAGLHPGILLRLTPLALITRPTARRMVERNILVYRRQWILLLSGLLRAVLLPALDRRRT